MAMGKDCRDAGLYIGAVFLGQLLVGAIYGMIVQPVEQFVRTDAENTSYEWSRAFSSNLKDIDQIAAGQQPSIASQTFFRKSRFNTNILQIKLFDKTGKLRFILGKHGGPAIEQSQLSIRSSKAAKVAQSGVALTQLEEGKSHKGDTLHTKTYLPILVDGKTAIVAEIHVDQTAKRELFKSAFVFAAISVALIAATAFFVPMAAFYRRTREKKKADAKIAFLARHDAMTGLMNRNTFLERFGIYLDALIEPDKRVAVHYVDVDRFKEVNDTLGHDIGDEMICEVADRLRNIAGKNDLIGRMGGDEFVVIQTDATDQEKIENFAALIIEEMNKPFSVGQHSLAGTVSIGIAVAPTDGHNATDLLKKADLALYCVKEGGRNGYKCFEDEMNVELEARRKLEKIISSAAIDETFELHFQPLYQADTERLISFEALLRLPDGPNHAISPAVFVPIAEDMGVIGEIGAWVIEHACTVAAKWPDNLKIAVNLSPLQFKDCDIVGIVEAALEKSGLEANRLELEITEGLLLTNTESIMEQLKELKALGTSIVMDDFGTGYSSLNYLWQFPFDKIKIDRSFIQALDSEDQNVSNIIKTIISLGHSLNMSVTAEGVETSTQAIHLKNMSCDQLQGYYFGRPMKEQDATKKIFSDFTDALLKFDETSKEEKMRQAQNTSKLLA